MDIKAGDKLRVKPLEEIEALGERRAGRSRWREGIPCYFMEGMEKLCGHVVTVTYVHHVADIDGMGCEQVAQIEEDRWNWPDVILDPVMPNFITDEVME